MRDDPITYEDWKIANSTDYSFRMLKYFDYLFSVGLIVSLLVFAITERVDYLNFILVIIFIGITFLEIIVNQEFRSIFDRYLVIIGFLAIIFYTRIDIQLNIIISVLISLFLIAKLIILPINLANYEFTEEILLPANDKVEIVLQEHINRLEGTDFMIEDDSAIRIGIQLLSRRILIIYALPLVFVILYSISFISELVGLSTIIFLSIFLIAGFGLILLALSIQRYKSSVNKIVKQKNNQNNTS